MSSGIPDGDSKPRVVVHAWPDDAIAKSALRAYVEQLAQNEGAKFQATGLDLRGADLRGLSFRGADFTSARLEGVSFHGGLLNRADFSEAFIARACFDEAEMIDSDLFSASGEQASFARAWLSGLDALDANLTGANFSGAFLGGASFNGANLQGADLRDTKLERTFFVSSRLVDVYVGGMTGTLIGPCQLDEDSAEIGEAELQQRLRQRNADITVVPVNPT